MLPHRHFPPTTTDQILGALLERTSETKNEIASLRGEVRSGLTIMHDRLRAVEAATRKAAPMSRKEHRFKLATTYIIWALITVVSAFGMAQDVSQLLRAMGAGITAFNTARLD